MSYQSKVSKYRNDKRNAFTTSHAQQNVIYMQVKNSKSDASLHIPNIAYVQTQTSLMIAACDTRNLSCPMRARLRRPLLSHMKDSR